MSHAIAPVATYGDIETLDRTEAVAAVHWLVEQRGSDPWELLATVPQDALSAALAAVRVPPSQAAPDSSPSLPQPRVHTRLETSLLGDSLVVEAGFSLVADVGGLVPDALCGPVWKRWPEYLESVPELRPLEVRTGSALRRAITPALRRDVWAAVNARFRGGFPASRRRAA